MQAILDNIKGLKVLVLGDVESFELIEDRKVVGVDLVASVGGAGGDDADRGRGGLHGAHLHRGGVGAQEFTTVEVEGVLLVSRWVIVRSVEGIETVEFRFNLGTAGERKA